MTTSGYDLQPPDGWTYAQLDAYTLAKEGDAQFAMTLHDAPANARQLATARNAAYDALVKAMGVTPPRAKPNWAHPDEVDDAGSLKVSVWSIDGAKVGAKKGAIGVFYLPLPENKALLGIGFVPDDDGGAAAKAILTAVQTIAKTASP